MQVDRIVGALVDRSGKTGEAVSAELGKSRAFISVTRMPGRSPALATVADVADVCGFDLAVVDRATGDVVGTIDPPRRSPL